MDTKLVEQITEMLDKLPNSICNQDTSIDGSWIEAGESEFNLKLPEYYRWFIVLIYLQENMIYMQKIF